MSDALCWCAGGAFPGLGGAAEPEADTRPGDWRGMGLMQLLKRASKRRNSSSTSGYGLDLAIARLTNAGGALAPSMSTAQPHTASVLALMIMDRSFH